jgi:hypothetical protein
VPVSWQLLAAGDDTFKTWPTSQEHCEEGSTVHTRLICVGGAKLTAHHSRRGSGGSDINARRLSVFDDLDYVHLIRATRLDEGIVCLRLFSPALWCGRQISLMY